MKKKPLVLCILDGYGITDKNAGNAIELANKPYLDMMMNKYPHGKLNASEEYVGLPHGQMGNSEVGHLSIGAGRKVFQSLTLVSNAIYTQEFFTNKVLLSAIENVQKNNSNLHIMGLLSDGGVHSHISHIFAAMKLAHDSGIKKAFLHIFLDGRDTDQISALRYIDELEKEIKDKNYSEFSILTVSGRYYSMDRDKRWERVGLAYDAMVSRKGEYFSDLKKYIEDSYSKKIYDEFVVPAYNANIDVEISDNDSIIACNFRPDRMIQLASIFTNPNYEFTPSVRRNNLCFVSMVKYADSVLAPFAFSNEKIANTVGEVVSKAGMGQLRIAETEKYAHVTFFFDGGLNFELPGEKRILIKSPKVATYDLKPEMSAYEVASTLVAELDKDYLDFIVLNLANCDMVGHSGIVGAAIKAVEAVDKCVGQIYEKLQELGGKMIIIADHGNAECMLDKTLKNAMTAHTTNLVPFILTSNDYEMVHELGALTDVAPTILYLLNLEIPKEMTGKVLVKSKEVH